MLLNPYRYASQQLWTPAQITTLGWYDASDEDTITESSGFVSQIDDLSGNDEHLVQTTGSLQPETGVRTQNSLNVLDFTNLNYLQKTSFPLPSSGDVTFLMVAEIDGNINQTASSIYSIDSAADFQLCADTTSNFQGDIRISVAGDLDLGATNKNGPSIYCCTFDYGTNFRGIVDGTTVGTSTGYTGTKLATSQTLRMFANRAGNASMDGM